MPHTLRNSAPARRRPRGFPAALLACALAWAVSARAGAPYATDDPQPTPPGQWALLLSGQAYQGENPAEPDETVWFGAVPQLELNHGLAPGWEAHLQIFGLFSWATGE